MSQPIEKAEELSIEEKLDRSEIAIVDDDPSFSFMLKDYLLSSAEIKSRIFSHGDDFLKNYGSNDVRTIILDYEFNDGPDGLTILQKIRAVNPRASVIMVSAQDDLEKAVETLRKGASDYFVKTNKTVFANILSSLMKIREMEKNKWN